MKIIAAGNIYTGTFERDGMGEFVTLVETASVA